MARHVLRRDYELRGVLNLKKVGAHRYAADPNTEVMCCAFAVDDEPVQALGPRRSDPAGIHRGRAQSRTGMSQPTAIISRPRSSNTSWRRATAGRLCRSSGTAAPWRWLSRLDCRRKLGAASGCS